jgi:hypothetical protein
VLGAPGVARRRPLGTSEDRQSQNISCRISAAGGPAALPCRCWASKAAGDKRASSVSERLMPNLGGWRTSCPTLQVLGVEGGWGQAWIFSLRMSHAESRRLEDQLPYLPDSARPWLVRNPTIKLIRSLAWWGARQGEWRWARAWAGGSRRRPFG